MFNPDMNLGEWVIIDLNTGAPCFWPAGFSPYPFATENDAMTFCAHLNQAKAGGPEHLYAVMRSEQ